MNPKKMIGLFVAFNFFVLAGSALASSLNCNTNCKQMCGGGVAGAFCIAECEPLVAAACAVNPNPNDHWVVSVRNNCKVNVQVSAHYMTNEQKPKWTTNGWWQLGPGDEAQIFSTKNRYLYIYAESTPHGQYKWQGSHHWTVRGRSVGMIQKEIESSNYGRWTETLNCN